MRFAFLHCLPNSKFSNLQSGGRSGLNGCKWTYARRMIGGRPPAVLAQPARSATFRLSIRERLVMADAVGTGSRPAEVNQPVETSALDFTLRRLGANIVEGADDSMAGGGGSNPGERRGGRQRGAPNKRTLDVIERLAALHCDPIAGMARIALNKKNPVEVRARMFAELAHYIAPKRKALEHSAEPGMIVELLPRIDA
jgi:hypothetical protein